MGVQVPFVGPSAGYSAGLQACRQAQATPCLGANTFPLAIYLLPSPAYGTPWYCLLSWFLGGWLVCLLVCEGGTHYIFQIGFDLTM